jgi:hypothetical protein
LQGFVWRSPWVERGGGYPGPSGDIGATDVAAERGRRAHRDPRVKRALRGRPSSKAWTREQQDRSAPDNDAGQKPGMNAKERGGAGSWRRPLWDRDTVRRSRCAARRESTRRPPPSAISDSASIAPAPIPAAPQLKPSSGADSTTRTCGGIGDTPRP